MPMLRRAWAFLLDHHPDQSGSRTLLFDTGPEDWVFERNAVGFAANLGEVGAVVLSHGHWDHGGAMPVPCK